MKAKLRHSGPMGNRIDIEKAFICFGGVGDAKIENNCICFRYAFQIAGETFFSMF